MHACAHLCMHTHTYIHIHWRVLIVKKWKQPKCTLMDEWTNKMWYLYAVEYYSAVKREENSDICSKMDKP